MIFHVKGRGEGGEAKKLFFMTMGVGRVRQKVIFYDKGNLGVRQRCFSPTKSGNLVSRAFWKLCDLSLVCFLKTLRGEDQ